MFKLRADIPNYPSGKLHSVSLALGLLAPSGSFTWGRWLVALVVPGPGFSSCTSFLPTLEVWRQPQGLPSRGHFPGLILGTRSVTRGTGGGRWLELCHRDPRCAAGLGASKRRCCPAPAPALGGDFCQIGLFNTKEAVISPKSSLGWFLPHHQFFEN